MMSVGLCVREDVAINFGRHRCFAHVRDFQGRGVQETKQTFVEQHLACRDIAGSLYLVTIRLASGERTVAF
jgi:hypothetical protein